jgi:integrase
MDDTRERLLRRLPLAKSSCAKIRNLMSVLFNHACRYELFDRNPIHLVRQGAKRRRAPTVLIPAEIKALVDSLGIRERTLVLLAVSTGLRQSELFGLKWGDIDLVQYSYTQAITPAKHASSGSSRVVGVFVRSEPNVTTVCLGRRCSVRTIENGN